jgi:hypothetical protein
MIPDISVFGFLILSFLSAGLSVYTNNCWLILVVLIVMLYRLYEMLLTVTNNYFFSQYDKKTAPTLKSIASMRRSLILLVLNIIDAINIFVVVNSAYARYVLQCKELGLSYWYKSTAYCLLTFNQDMLLDRFPKLENLAFIQTMIGLFLLVTVLSRIISDMPSLKVIENERNIPD